MDYRQNLSESSKGESSSSLDGFSAPCQPPQHTTEPATKPTHQCSAAERSPLASQSSIVQAPVPPARSVTTKTIHDAPTDTKAAPPEKGKGSRQLPTRESAVLSRASANPSAKVGLVKFASLGQQDLENGVYEHRLAAYTAASDPSTL